MYKIRRRELVQKKIVWDFVVLVFLVSFVSYNLIIV